MALLSRGWHNSFIGVGREQPARPLAALRPILHALNPEAIHLVFKLNAQMPVRSHHPAYFQRQVKG
jgi:hypothetical protein